MSARIRGTGATDVIIGGFCGSAAGYEELRHNMQETTGNNTVFIPSARWAYPFIRNHGAYPRALYRQALNVADRLRAQGVYTVRVYGHSMGGAVALIFADAFHRSFGIDRVVALNPACLYLDGVMPLAKRMYEKGRRDQHDLHYHPNPDVRRIIRAGRPGAFRYMSNPVRATAEGLALSRTPLFTRLLPSLSAKPIRVMVGYSDEDIVFLPNQMLEAINTFPGIESFRLDNTPHDMQYVPAATVDALKRHGAL